MRCFFRVFFTGLFILSGSTFSANVIFDLDGVLLRKNSFAAFWEIGVSNLIGIYNPFNLEKKLFDFLHSIEPRKSETPAATRNGKLLPQIMCDWLLGVKSNEQILQILLTALDNNNFIFSSQTEKNIIKEVIKIMFTPARSIRITKHVKRGMKLLKRCYNQKDGSGNRKHKIYILSNWDLESFELLVRNNQKIRKILSYCDGFIISGEVNLMKPDQAIFNYLFNTYKIDPDNEITVYIDDEETNIEAAQKLNKKQLHAIFCKNFTYKPVKKKLRELKIIE